MTDVYQMVTDRILEMFDRNIVPWHCPWTRTGAGCISYSTGRPYSLLNQLLLGGRPGEYITFNQARELGGNVRKGEKSRFVVFWKLFEEKDDETGDISIKPLLRYYNVFHIDQCEHISPRWAVSVQDAAKPTLHHDDRAEKAILDYMRRFRDEYSKAAAKGSSPWESSFDEMAKKTVLKRCLKYAPLKPEFISAAAEDDTVKTALSDDMLSQPDEKDSTVIHVPAEMEPDTGETA